MEKGQVTVEFTAVIALATIIFLVVVNLITQERRATSQAMWAADAEDTAMKIARTINSIYLAGDGAKTNLTLPKKLVGGLNYTVTLRPHLVTVYVPAYGREFECKHLTGDVEGGASSLTLQPGTTVFENVNGSVEITQWV